MCVIPSPGTVEKKKTVDSWPAFWPLMRRHFVVLFTVHKCSPDSVIEVHVVKVVSVL